jgi:predicted N-acyltransferase
MPEFKTHATLAGIPAAQWDALHDGDNPFVRHAFLRGLEQHGCLRPQWGWTPLHAALWEGDTLIAAAPGYLKGNSHGEFVFDHAWAAALERAGLDYFPKWLFAVPYTPVAGPRLLARDADARGALCRAIADEARRRALPSLHVNFLPESENADCPAAWLERNDVQFHWRNGSEDRAAAPWRDFEDFLAALQSKKRKNIRHERAQVREAGIVFRIVHGDEAGPSDIADMHALYLRAFADKGNSPALTLAFFQHLATAMPRSLVLILAQRDGTTIAGALCLRGGRSRHPDSALPSVASRDTGTSLCGGRSRHPASLDTGTSLCGGGTLYGRYWGCFEDIPGLHFETCYYQGIEYCLREGLSVFEPGAQGEHKIARGFLPVLTRSRHHFIQPGLNDAFARWCAEERASVRDYRDAVLAHSPYRESSGSGRMASP